MSDEERARFEVLLERIESKVELISEGHAELNAKFDRMEGKVDQLTEDVSLVKMDVGFVKKDVVVLKKDVAVLKIDLGGFKAETGKRLGRIENQLGLNGAPKPKRRPTKT